MYREVSDLSFGSISEGDDPVEASPQSEIVEGGHDTSWRTYTNNLDVEADGEDSGADDTVQDSAVSSERLPSTRGMVRFNTAFEADQDEDQQAEQNNLPASWAASEMSNLALIAAHLAAAALPPVQQSSPDQYAADAVLLPSPLTAEDMLGCGTLDLRSCTLNRRAATFAATQRLGTHASFCIPPQVTDSNAMVARTSSVFRHGSSVGEQLQALASRTGISFSGGLRLQPSFPGINFSDLKKQVLPDGEDFKPETYLSRLHQHTDLAGLRAGKRNLQGRSDDHQSQVKQMMKEHLKGVSSSLVLIDNIHMYVRKAEGPHVQHRRSDAVHASIHQVQAEAAVTFDSILQRQALLGKARQEQQLAVRFTSVLGFGARLHGFCQSRQYSQILPAYEQASALIQTQIQATPDSHADWGVLHTLMDQALTQTSLQVLGQLNEGKDSPAQLDNGLQLVLHLQHLNSKVKDGSSNTCCVALFIEHQGKKAQQALAQCLAHVRTQDPQAQRDTVPKAFLQGEALDAELDGDFELMAATAMMQHMATTQAVQHATTLVSQMLGVMTHQVHWLWTVAQQHMPALVTNSRLRTAALAIAEDSVAAAHAAVQAFTDLCRQHLFQLLEELSMVMQQAAAASAPHCAACLLRLTHALARHHASLASQSLPPNFVQLLAEAVGQSVGLCVSCACHQVQAINLRLATSDLFDVQGGAASGRAGRHRSSSSMESSLKALLHTCHRLLQAGCQAWLLSHMASVWNTLFDSFQAFCQTCQQLTTASCAAAAHPQQQQAQAQQKLRSEHSSQGSVQLQSVAARVAMFNAMDSGKGNKSRCNAPPLAVQQGTEQQARLEQEGVPQTHMQQPQRLLTLLTRCAQMEHLLAYLLPGFLTLSPVEAQQHQMATYLMTAVWERGEPASGVHPAAVDLLVSLVEVQADLVCLAPPACLTQVMRVIVKQMIMEWYEQAQSVVSDDTLSLFAAMQLSFDLHFLAASLHPYTTPAGASLLCTCHTLLEQVVSHRLCEEDEQCRQVQEAYGSHTSVQSVAAWLSQLGRQAVDWVSSNSSFSTDCLVQGASLGQAAMSAPVPSPSTRLASVSSRLAPHDSPSDMPPSPRRRLVAHRPVSSVQSRLVGRTASSAAALVALQRKFAAPSTPRSPTIKAVYQTPSQQSVMPVLDALDHQASHYQGAKLAASQRQTSKLSRLNVSGISHGDGLRSDSQKGSTLDPKDRHSRKMPPVLQPQNSISLNAIAAIRRPPPLYIPVQA